MSLRLFAPLLLLALLAGCTWEGRPDGADAVHTASDGYFDDGIDPTETPLGDGGIQPLAPVDAEIIEPPGDASAPGAAPVPMGQPAPTSGTIDNTSEVEEALTPGSEQ